MKAYIYELVVTDPAGWDGEDLWGDGLKFPEDRLFRTRSEAVAAKRDLDATDYAATVANADIQDDDYEPPHQPTFCVQRIATVEAIWQAAIVWPEQDTLERVLELAGVRDVADDLWDMSPTDILAWITTLPRQALRAAAGADMTTAAAENLARASAATRGASSATHTYALLGAAAAGQAADLRSAIAAALSA